MVHASPAEVASVDAALLAACRAEAPLVLDRTFDLSSIAAPPLHEAERAARVRSWWESDGLTVTAQPVGNLWARVRAGSDPAAPALVIAAHLDTVFARDVQHGLRWAADGSVVGPGCGDDSVAVAALATLDRLLTVDTAAPVWIVATVGEEGLGNLAGARAVFEDPPTAVAAFIALEGNYLGRVNTVGVGSERRRVRIVTSGGHAWEDATAPSAIHVAADLVHRIDGLESDHPGRTSRNVGLIAGGESINSRARAATFDVDLRSESAAALRDLTNQTEELLAVGRAGVTVSIEMLGSRPAGGIALDHPLVVAAADSLAEVGISARLTAASTDANVAYDRGVPAVTLGITYGDGTHTEQEWIDPAAICYGLYALTRTVGRWPGPPATANPSAATANPAETRTSDRHGDP